MNEDNIKRYHTNSKTREAHRQASYRYTIKTYGLTVERYNELLEKQNHVCAICGNKPKNRLCVDHDHKTGKVRSLLCNKCNTAIGNANEDIGILKKMIEYLELSSERLRI